VVGPQAAVNARNTASKAALAGISPEGLEALVEGRHGDPFSLLGPHRVEHKGRQAVSVRAFLPGSRQVWVVHSAHNRCQPMRRIHAAGFFEAICPAPESGDAPSYELRVADQSGGIKTMQDPYRFPPMLTDYDLYLLGEGTHWSSYDRLGAQPRSVDGVSGVNFAVWAPNATSVSVVGDFNEWDGRRHPMRKHIPSGIWEIFIPHAGPGTCYKYRVKHGHHIADKADPYGFSAETPPRTASVVEDLNHFEWNDHEWMGRRRETNWLERPISIYEVHLGSWRMPKEKGRTWLWYRELAEQLVEYCHKMNYTHVELLPVSEHPYTASWGYQTVGYYAVTSRFGSPYDFMYFVDYLHRHGIGVILDWVPAHFPRDAHGLRRFDGTALYEHEDPRQGEHPDWGTLIFNYGRNEVRNFLLSNSLFWLDKYHIDGLRVDAVASMLYLDYSREEGQWIPNEYGGRENLPAISLLKGFNELVHGHFPGVLTVAEESTAWDGVSRPTYAGGLGFSLKWNMGWMNDTLTYFRFEPIHRKYHHDQLTFSMIYAFSENFTLPLSHDEIVHGKRSLLMQMPGDLWQKFANLRSLFAYKWTHPGKKLLFMGSDFGQWNEWDHDSELQWDLLEHGSHRGLQRLVADLNAMYRREPALYEVDFEGHGFEWIDCHQCDNSTLAFLRKAKDSTDQLVVLCNFTPVVRHNARFGVTRGGWYQEILNTDSEYYDGTNVGNHPGVMAEPIESQGRPFSINVTLPPLAVTVFKPTD
jgi:1,4-alpha-glucan branching enzyme